MTIALPHDRTAENAVLAAIITRGRDALSEVQEHIRDPSAFYIPANCDIYRSLLAVEKSGEPFDLVIIAGELRRANALDRVGGVDTLQALVREAAVGDTIRHAQIISRAAARRDLFIATREANEQALKEPDISISISRLRRVLDRSDLGTESMTVPISVAVNEARETVLTRAKGGEQLVPTGFEALDALLGKGIAPGELLILGGVSGGGKTAFALSVARNCVLLREPKGEGRRSLYRPKPVPIPVLFISGEMAVHELVMRWISDMTGIDGRDLRSPSAEQLSQFGGNMEYAFTLLGSVEITLTRPRQVYDFDTIAAVARSWRAAMRRKYGDDVSGVVMVDFLQLIDAPSGLPKTMRSDQIEGAKAKGAKRLAQELGVPVIALSQLNSGPDERPDHRPQRCDLRGSREIEHFADAVGLIYRPWIYEKDLVGLEDEFQALRSRHNRKERYDTGRFADLAARRGLCEIGFVKARAGAANIWKPLQFTPELTRFLDAPR
jgi:replicative DNA helicase